LKVSACATWASLPNAAQTLLRCIPCRALDTQDWRLLRHLAVVYPDGCLLPAYETTIRSPTRPP
jgi:hypothetical protein